VNAKPDKLNAGAFKTDINMTYRVFFLLGLLFFLIGQIILAQGNEFVYSQQPIDFAH
jgi:hypothetical protein